MNATVQFDRSAVAPRRRVVCLAAVRGLIAQYPFSVPSASCRHNETMRDANNTPNQSVAADVSRLKLDPRPARNGRLRNRSDPAHAGCYKREWKSTRATGQGAIAGSTIGVAFKPMLNRYKVRFLEFGQLPGEAKGVSSYPAEFTA